jgi:hypothetical protein
MVELKKILQKSKSESGQRQKFQDLISDFEQFENLLQSKFDLNFS